MTFSNEVLQAVWEKGFIVPGVDANQWRKDACGAWIERNAYGNRGSSYGWDVDHITPESRGGSSAIGNLRPLQWENNAARQAEPLDCVVSSVGNENVRRVR